MIYHYKMKQPVITGGGSEGDGLSIQTPWYWYEKTQGTTIELNNENADYDDATRLYIRVKLEGGTTYNIGESTDFDGCIWLYDTNGNYVTGGTWDEAENYGGMYADDRDSEISEIYCSDSFEFTPESTGIYIIGAGSYPGNPYKGNYTVAIYPAPLSDPIPSSEITITYPTSEGFNDFGKAIKYRSASQCNINKNLFPNAVWGYKNGNILKDLKTTATNNNVVADENGYFTFGNDKFFVLDKSLMNNSSPRTFVFQATLTASNGSIQFVDGGQDNSGCLFSLGWNYNSNQMAYHFSYDDNTNWYELQEGSYMIAFVYDGETLYLYVNGQQVNSSEHGLDTSGSNYYIGNYGPDSIYSMHGEWKSKFCIIYDRALEQSEIASFNKFA